MTSTDLLDGPNSAHVPTGLETEFVLCDHPDTGFPGIGAIWGRREGFVFTAVARNHEDRAALIGRLFEAYAPAYDKRLASVSDDELALEAGHKPGTTAALDFIVDLQSRVALAKNGEFLTPERNLMPADVADLTLPGMEGVTFRIAPKSAEAAERFAEAGIDVSEGQSIDMTAEEVIQARDHAASGPRP